VGLITVVHKIAIGDVDDVEFYSAMPLKEFKSTEKCQWLEKHSLTELEYRIGRGDVEHGYVIVIFANLNIDDLNFFKSKWN
jgi:hypothetical protein